MTKDVLKYLQPNAVIPIDMETTTALVNALKERLAQPEQEPVATLEDLEQEIYQNTRNFVSRDVMEWMLRRYYTHPPQRTEPTCPECKAVVLYECVACSSNNYPPKETT
jgi:hypothetical protein